MTKRNQVGRPSKATPVLSRLHELVLAHLGDTEAFVDACLALGCEALGVQAGLVSTAGPDDPRVRYVHSSHGGLEPGDAVPAEATLRIPIESNGKCLGVLGFVTAVAGPTQLLSAAHRPLLTAMAEALARFLERDQQDARQRQVHQRLRERAQLLESSFQHALIGQAIEEVATQRIVEVNPALCQLLGYPRDVLIGTTFSALSHPDDRAAAGQLIDELIRGQRTSGELEKRYRRQDGHIIDAYVGITLVRDAAGAAQHLFVQVLDITDRKAATAQLQAANRELERLAFTDSLTGLWNRRYFDRMLAHEWVRARRYQTPLSLMLLDLDNLKCLNDRYGHDIGDRVLATLGRLLGEQIRAVDVIARYGGDEFAIVLPETDEPAAHRLAERCRQAVAAYPWAHHPVTVSVGVASLDVSTATAAELVRHADQALYAAKAGRRDTTIRGTRFGCGRESPGGG